VVVINEVLADPGTTNDANCDGVVDSTQDEAVELVNLGPDAVDISGWTVSDATSTRFTFPAGTVLAVNDGAFVVGGGTYLCTGVDGEGFVGGTLSLNNTGDTVRLADASGGLVDEVVYGSEGNFDQSLVRAPELTGASFVQPVTRAWATPVWATRAAIPATPAWSTRARPWSVRPWCSTK
jgi:Lamin Tail Domain